MKTLFGREKNGIIAESWEVSVHKDGESRISGTDKTFAGFLKENKNAVDLKGGEFSVLIKYIDAAKNPSVQVHPNDEYAQKYEHDNGKTEMWYIVLGGGICAAGDVFLMPLKRKVNRGIFGGTKFAPIEIVVASLGNDAGIYGAAALAFNKD